MITKIHAIYEGYKWKYYRRYREPEKHVYFRINDEPNLNYTCEPLPIRGPYTAHFIDSSNNERFTFFLSPQYRHIKYKISFLHERIMANISVADNLQNYLEMHPHRNDLTRDYESHIHTVKEDMSSIRKLETVYMIYNSSYTRKPEYTGEQRDNVNTY